MARDRAGLFDEDDEVDLSGFVPKAAAMPPPDRPDEVRRAAAASGFVSREPSRPPRRHRTHRNVQFNVKAKRETIDTIHRLADANDWLIAETIEHAVAALERELEAGRPLPPLPRGRRDG